MAHRKTGRTESYIFWDTNGAGANPIAAYQCVSLANPTEVAAALAAGCRDASFGRLVIPTPVGALLSVTMGTRRIVGVTLNSAFSGDELLVQCDGIAEVMVNAATAADAILYAVAQATRTSLQTPLINTPELLIPVDPRATITYQLCLADDPAPTFDSTAANVPLYPLGFGLVAATAQYDVIPVELQLGVVFG